jgi:solute carrier family 25 iron transporter 28/37
MQILSPALSTAPGAAAGASTAPLSLAQHFRLVSSTEGIRSLWRGVASVIMGAGPAHACHFGTYEFVREMTGGDAAGVQGAAGTAVAGAAATIASDAFMNPFDGESWSSRGVGWCADASKVIKQRMQIRGSVHKSVIECAKTVYRTEGFQAFYISYPTTLTMSIPLSAVQFSVYEAMKSFLNPTGEYSPSTHVMAGGVAGATAAAVTTPLDVAKVCPQTSHSGAVH